MRRAAIRVMLNLGHRVAVARGRLTFIDGFLPGCTVSFAGVAFASTNVWGPDNA